MRILLTLSRLTIDAGSRVLSLTSRAIASDDMFLSSKTNETVSKDQTNNLGFIPSTRIIDKLVSVISYYSNDRREDLCSCCLTTTCAPNTPSYGDMCIPSFEFFKVINNLFN